MRAKNDTTPPQLGLLAVQDGYESTPGFVETERRGRAEVIRLRGVLPASPSFFSFFETEGGDVSSLEHLANLVKDLDADEEVDLIGFDLQGFGTHAARLDATAETIRRAKTRTAAFVSTAFSGFAVLAQAADHVAGSPASTVGSVNVKLGFLERLEDDGLRVVSGSRLKKEWAEGKFSDEVKADMQSQVDAQVKVFRDFIAEARGLTEAQLDEIFTGKTFVGQEAVQVGLLDDIFPTMDAFLASLETEAPMPQDITAAPPAGAADQDTATTASTPAAADEEGLFQRILARLSGTGAAAAPPAVPAASATPPTEPAPAVDPQVAAMAAKMKEMEADLAAMKAKATEDAEAALRAEVTATGIPATLVETEVATLSALLTAGEKELYDKHLAALKSYRPPTLNPAAFGDLGAPADGSFSVESVASGDPRVAKAVADARAAAGDDDPEKALAALEAADAATPWEGGA